MRSIVKKRSYSLLNQLFFFFFRFLFLKLGISSLMVATLSTETQQ